MIGLRYVLRFLIFGLAFGCYFASNEKRFSHFKIENRFIMGFSGAILFIPMIDYILGIVWPGIPKKIVKYALPVLPAIYLIYRFHFLIIWEVVKAVGRRLYGWTKEIWASFSESVGIIPKLEAIWNVAFRILILVMMIVIMKPVFTLSDTYSYKLQMGSDECHYLTQARYFAEDRKSLEIDNYTDEKEGTVQPDDHGPLWVVYLGDALMFSGYEFYTFYVIVIAYKIAAFLMLVMLMNTMDAVMGSDAAWLALFVALSYRYMMHLPLFGSRDGFRFVALLLFINYIYELMCRAASKEDSGVLFSKADFGWLVVLTYLCLNGHGGNAYLIACLGLALTVGILFYTKRIIPIIWMGMATVLGAIPCLIKNILYFMRTGTFRSYTNRVFKDTIVEEIIHVNSANNAAAGKSSLFVDYTTEEKSILVFSIVLLVGIIIYCAVRWIRKHSASEPADKRDNKLIIMLVIICFLALPLTGILNFIAGNVKVWFFTQDRYRMYIFLTAGMLCGTVFAYFSGQGKWKRFVSQLLVLIPCGITICTIKNYYPTITVSYVANNLVHAIMEETREIDAQVGDGYAFCNDQIIIWYLENPTKYSTCENLRPLYLAETTEEIEKAIENLNINTFIYSWNGENYSKEFAYYQYLHDSGKYEYREVVFTKDTEIMEVFTINQE